MKKISVLITGGPAREWLDGVRFIGNASTGKTASAVAAYLARKGMKVIYLGGQGSERPAGKNIGITEYSDFRSLRAKIKSVLSSEKVDFMVHAAAVSDYSPAAVIADGKKMKPSRKIKISSSATEIKIELKRNFKILGRIKRMSLNKNVFVFGFKLTCGAGAREAREAAAALPADIVIHNDLAEMNEKHPFHGYRRGENIFNVSGAVALARKIYGIIRKEARGIKCS